MKALFHLFKIAGVILLCACFQIPLSAYHLTKPNEPGPWSSLQVNTYTGNLFYQRTDLHIPALGEIPLDMVFSYNSLKNQKDLGYGNGWSFSLGMWYSIAGNTITIGRDDGEEDEFTWNGSSYVPPVGVYDSLTEYLTGKYLLKTKYGIRYYFDDSGHKQLTKIQDRNGNSITFSFTGGKLTTITDPSGRQLNLSWLNDHLAQITDPNTTPDRVISFQYDGSWNMILVTRPLSNIYQFGYDSNRNMISVTDPRSNTVTIFYDLNEAVAGISYPSVSYNKSFLYDNCNNTTTVSQVVSLITRQTIYTFDFTGRIIKMQYPDGNSIRFKWDSFNNIIADTNENGSITSYTYDARANLLNKTDCLGNEEYYTYDTTYNKITSFVNQIGNHTLYSYDGSGNLTGKTDCLSHTESYIYDAYGNLINMIDKNGLWTTYSYDVYGNVTGVYYPMSYSESNSFDLVGNMLTSIDKRGFTTTYTYDLLDRHTGTLDALGYTSNYSYDGNGNLVSETNPNSFFTTYSYDALNRMIRKTDALGGITSHAYDAAGNILSDTNANGCITSFTYDSRNRLINQLDPLGNAESYSYDAVGHLISSTDKNGNTTNYQYDCLGRLTMTIGPDGSVETYAYNDTGNKTFYSNNGISTTYDYDCLNRLTAIYYPLGYSELSEYDDVGNRTSFTDKNGNTTSYAYDAMRRLFLVTDPLSATESYYYDGEGNRIGYMDKNGNTTSYGYDDAGRLISTTDPLLSTESYILDGIGNRLTVTDKRGYNTYYAYDGLNRLISTTESGGEITESYAYDPMGNRTSHTDKNGNTTDFIYDCNSQKVYEIDALDYFESYLYSPTGKMTDIADKNGNNTSLDYSCCRLASVTDPLGFTEDYTYDLAGNRLTNTDRNGHVTTYAYDDLNRLTSITTPLGNQTLYTYDGNGNTLSKTDANLNTITYSYNTRNELVTTTYPDASAINYTYDSRGNLTQTINTGGIGETINYTYDALNRLVSKATDYGSFSKAINSAYDLNGNCTGMTSESGTISYECDALNRVIQITDQNSDVTTLEYDAVGNQTAINYPNGVTTSSTYDAMGRVTEVITADIPPPLAPIFIKPRNEPKKSGKILFNVDCGVMQILSPVSGPGLTNSEPVIILLMNYGINTVYSSIVSYSIDGGTPVTQNLYQPLFPGTPVPFTFSQPADFSIPGQTYQLYACITVAGDLFPPNNCMTSYIVNEIAVPTVYQSFAYQYDAGGNKMSETHEDGTIISFGYSQRNELITESFSPSGDLNEYTYTPTGKRASKTENGVLSEYEYNDDDVLIAAGDKTFIPDDNGNRITKTDPAGTTDYIYGYRNELNQVTLPDLDSTSYVYAVQGGLIEHEDHDMIPPNRFSLSNGREILEEFDSAGTVVNYYNPGISINHLGSTGYYYHNGFGSATFQMDPAKVVLAAAKFDAFGNIKNSTGSWLDNRIIFANLKYEDTVSLYYDSYGHFLDGSTGTEVNQNPGDKTKDPGVKEPEINKPLKTGGGNGTEEIKRKCCGVAKFEVEWSEQQVIVNDGFSLARLDIEIEFMDDDKHSPACCAYCQNVETSWGTSNKNGKFKWGGHGMQDDKYSRNNDRDGNKDPNDPHFYTNDNPGLKLKNYDKGDAFYYYFNAEQLVLEICPFPCPYGSVVARRGPHAVSVRSDGETIEYNYGGTAILNK
jgi:YD repeat-containing protein